MGYKTENGGILITNFRKKEEETIAWTWENGKEKSKKLSKISRVDETHPSVQSLGQH